MKAAVMVVGLQLCAPGLVDPSIGVAPEVGGWGVCCRLRLYCRLTDLPVSLPCLDSFPVPCNVQSTCLVLSSAVALAPAVQLVGQFSAIGTALAQGVLLRHRLPWSIWPCTALMTAGAAMVIVPSMGHVSCSAAGAA